MSFCFPFLLKQRAKQNYVCAEEAEMSCCFRSFNLTLIQTIDITWLLFAEWKWYLLIEVCMARQWYLNETFGQGYPVDVLEADTQTCSCTVRVQLHRFTQTQNGNRFPCKY